MPQRDVGERPLSAFDDSKHRCRTGNRTSGPEPAVRAAHCSPPPGTNTHPLCPGCREPNAVRVLMESIEEMGERGNTVCVLGIGCYTAFAALMDVDGGGRCGRAICRCRRL